MRISRKAEYALRALVAMARGPQWIQIQELSRRENIPVKFLEQIMLTLRQGGLLTSKRGVGGGYSLRITPADITLADVITIVDGPIAPVPCAGSRAPEPCTCSDPGTCPVRIVMTGIQKEIEASFRQRTIEDLVKIVPDADLLAYEI